MAMAEPAHGPTPPDTAESRCRNHSDEPCTCEDTEWQRTPPDDTKRLTHDDDGVLTDLAMEASDAIRHFPFADFDAGDVKLTDKDGDNAEWVFELAVAATEAVLGGLGLSPKQAAATLLARGTTPPDDTTEGEQ
jgi:hypothetical protein